MDLDTAPLHSPPHWIEQNGADAKRHLGGYGRRSITTDCAAQPCRHLPHLKRLGDVIVRSGVEGRDLVVFAVTHGEHQNRNSWKETADEPARFYAAHPGHVDIK